MASPYYLPASLSGFLAWSANFDTQITGSPASFGLTAPQAAAYALLHTDFDTKLIASTNPLTRTPVSVADTQVAFGLARAEAQRLVQIFQASGLATPALAAIIAVTFRDTTKTPIAPPTAIPELALQSISPQAAKMRIKELGSLSNAMPVGSVGYQVAMSVAPVTPPTSPTELSVIGNGTRRFYDLSFLPAAIGETFYVAVRYVNAKQETGPWSNIVTSTVVGG